MTDSKIKPSLSQEELQLRRALVKSTRAMILASLPVEEDERDSLSGFYRGFYLQIGFSEIHPLMVLTLAKPFYHASNIWQLRLLSQLNLGSILGSHIVNEDVGCYSYRSTHWLLAELRPDRFFDILDRCVQDASRGFEKLTT